MYREIERYYYCLFNIGMTLNNKQCKENINTLKKLDKKKTIKQSKNKLSNLVRNALNQSTFLQQIIAELLKELIFRTSIFW